MINGGVTTVFVTDMDRAVAFYCDVLGMKLAYRAGNHWASLDGGPGMAIGLHPIGDHTPKSSDGGCIEVGLYSDSIEADVAALESKGVSVPDGVRDDGGGIKLAHFKDPDGNRLYLCQRS